MPATSPPRYATIQRAAEYLDVNPKTIRRHIAAGTLTGYRAGPRLIRVDLNEIDTMMRVIPAAAPR